jgi:nickel transport system ATP-binding protein
MTLFTVSQLNHGYPRRPDVLNDVTFTLRPGETVALLGRSGCGKSTLARLLVGLETPASGEILWQGKPLSALKGEAKRGFYRDIQMVFQDALSAVNPRKTVREIIREPLRHLLRCSRQEQQQKITAMMAAVELDLSLLDKRPPQLSGGQLQRVCLARALIVEPKLLILDEAVSSLDLVLQAGIIRLLKRLQQQSGVACLFITHDLRLVERFCQRVMVMEHGQLVETTAVQSPLRFQTAAGQALQRAVLPAFPATLTEGKLACSA